MINQMTGIEVIINNTDAKYIMTAIYPKDNMYMRANTYITMLHELSIKEIDLFLEVIAKMIRYKAKMLQSANNNPGRRPEFFGKS